MTMTIISPTRDFGVVRTILDSSWSGPWTLGSENDPSLRKRRDLNTLPVVAYDHVWGVYGLLMDPC